MKIKKNFKLRKILSDYIVVAEGVENVNFSKIISLNSTGAFLWEKLQDKEFTAEDMTKLLMDEYEVNYETAMHDSILTANKWIEVGIAEL